jgi:hypothetical protein
VPWKKGRRGARQQEDEERTRADGKAERRVGETDRRREG